MKKRWRSSHKLNEWSGGDKKDLPNAKERILYQALMIWVLAVYLILINIAGLMCMGIDKRRSIVGAWRIPEKVFFLLSAFGGSLGCLIGMYLFHHKTNHWRFVVFIPVILVLQIILALVLIVVI